MEGEPSATGSQGALHFQPGTYSLLPRKAGRPGWPAGFGHRSRTDFHIRRVGLVLAGQADKFARPLLVGMGAREPTARRSMAAIALGTWHSWEPSSLNPECISGGLVPASPAAGVKISVRFRTEFQIRPLRRARPATKGETLNAARDGFATCPVLKSRLSIQFMGLRAGGLDRNRVEGSAP